MALLADGWHMSSHALAITSVTRDPTLTPGQVRRQLAAHPEIVHVTIEVQRCD